MAAKQITLKRSGIKQTFIMLSNSVGNKFGQGTAGLASSSLMPGASGRRCEAGSRNHLKARALN